MAGMSRARRALVALIVLLWPVAGFANSGTTIQIPPGLQVDLIDAEPNRVVLRLENGKVEQMLLPLVRKALDELRTSNPLLGSLKPQALGVSFAGFSPGAETLNLDVDVDTELFRCHIRPRWRLSKAPILTAAIADDGSRTDCATGNDLLKLSGLIPAIEAKLTSTVVDALSKGKLVQDSEKLDQWLKEDLQWGTFVKPALISMSYCAAAGGQPSLCITIEWPNQRAIIVWRDALLAKAPTPSKPADVTAMSKLAIEYRALAGSTNLMPSPRVPSKAYPAEFNNGTYNDFDMVLFGGLSCLAGEPRGCELVKYSQDYDGRFWRSPARVGKLQASGEATFSGDAFNGVVAYLTASDNRPALRKYLNFIRTHKQTILGQTAYKSCVGDDSYQCVLGGAEWYFLKLLAKRSGDEALLPKEFRGDVNPYGFTQETLAWQALIAPAGYRLHLVGVQVMLARRLAGPSPTLDQTARLLAARQPENPFFAYLSLGADAAVEESARQKCNPANAQTEYTDWTWQRATADPAWQRSMRWDCQFIYLLLAGTAARPGGF